MTHLFPGYFNYKKCKGCGESKSINCFHRRRNGLKSRCKDCSSLAKTSENGREDARRWRENLKGKDPLGYYLKQALTGSILRANKGNHLPCNATVEELVKEWTGSCYVCGVTNEEHLTKNKRWLHTDHCHKTGKFRAFLCCSCNMTVGVIEKSPEILTRLIELLSKS